MAIELLVLQPTPFCNIDCDYCYLPDRDNRSRMTFETLAAAVGRVLDSRLVGTDLSIVWHAGEPLTLPRDYYRTAFAVIAKLCPPTIKLRHSFQTNGVLIDDAWCALIQDHAVNVGLSIDGPAWLHDRHRKTRAGRGTHAQAMRGLECLQAHELPFHVISVLTRDSLEHADAIIDFFLDAGVRQLAFNIEEIEAANPRSSLAVPSIEAEFRRFFQRVVTRLRATPDALSLREIDDVIRALRHPGFGVFASNCQNAPFEIVSISWDGGIGTFSPELLGFFHPAYGRLVFGNVHHDDFGEIVSHSGYARVASDIAAGVSACRRSCAYFPFCRGGAPANKLAETDTFAATETLYCRLTQKVVIEVVLAALERDLNGPPSPEAAQAPPIAPPEPASTTNRSPTT